MTDPTTRYVKQTPCEEHGYYGPHCANLSPEHRGHGVGDCAGCPGGSRTLLTVREVDYEAGAIALARHHGVPPERVSSSAKRVANDVIQAAFGGSVVLVEERE